MLTCSSQRGLVLELTWLRQSYTNFVTGSVISLEETSTPGDLSPSFERILEFY